MNYKRLFPSRKLRIKILEAFNWIPDEWMVRFQYHLHTGNKLNLKDPHRFTEKLQWYKLRYRDPLMKRCVDKAEARKVVEEKGFGNLLVSCYGIYDAIDEIDFESLPHCFVAKDTMGGGGNSVIIVKDKSKLNKKIFFETLASWNPGSKTKKPSGREWVYEGHRKRIIIEELIEAENPTLGVVDYKLHCFNGKVRIINVIAGRKLGERSPFAWLDENFNRLPITWLDEDELKDEINKPSNFKEIITIAEKLSTPFPYVRVDLYNEKNQIRFGELTFFHASGYMKFSPDSADFDLGKHFQISNIK